MKYLKCALVGSLVMPFLAMAADVVEFKAIDGDDATCPTGYSRASAMAAINYKDFACRAIKDKGGARLLDKSAMSGASGGCNVYSFPVNKVLPATLCYQVKFKEIEGEVKSKEGVQCPTGTRLATPAEAVIFNKQACSALGGEYHIARLAYEGSISGSKYGCIVNTGDSSGKGHSLCMPE